MNFLNIYIDGSCRKNPGPGGIGIIINYKNIFYTFNKSFKYTTNNRMEIIASIYAIKMIKKKKINIFTDSKYLKNGITNWIKIWVLNKWKLKYKNKKIKNLDLWKKLYLISLKNEINWIWIKGHKDKLHNICDKIAKKASKK